MDGEDARDDRAGDPNLTAVSRKLEKDVSREEELGDDEVSAGIHFLLQVLEIIFVAGAVWMTSRVACAKMVFQFNYHIHFMDLYDATLANQKKIYRKVTEDKTTQCTETDFTDQSVEKKKN